MTADQNGFASARCDIDLGWRGMAVGARVGGIQQLHDFEVHFSDLERKRQEFVNRRFLACKHIENFIEGRVDGTVFATKNGGVFRIGRGTFEAVENELLEASNVRAQASDPATDGTHRGLL